MHADPIFSCQVTSILLNVPINVKPYTPCSIANYMQGECMRAWRYLTSHACDQISKSSMTQGLKSAIVKYPT